MSNLTLTQFILENRDQYPHSTGQFTRLLNAVENASKFVSSKVRAAGLFELYGAEGSTNVQGEQVKKLDVVANEAFITALRRSHAVSLIVSEENEGASAGHRLDVLWRGVFFCFFFSLFSCAFRRAHCGGEQPGQLCGGHGPARRLQQH